MSKIILTGIVLSAGLFANSSENNMNINEIGNFYYKQGYSQGYKSGYEAGYRDALNFAKEKLNEYLLKIRAYEAGKYLIKSKKITYPQIFYVKLPDDSIKVVIKNSKIEKEISPEDIIYIPKLKNETFNNIKKTDENSNVSNAVGVKDVQTNIETPKPSNQSLKTYYIYMPNTQTYKAILNKAGLVYAEDGNKLKIIFASKKNADNFIKDFGLKKNVDYFIGK
jgi:hypothetical protein